MLSALIAAAAAVTTAPPVICNGTPVPNLNPGTMVHVRMGTPGATATETTPTSITTAMLGGAASAQAVTTEIATSALGNGGAPYGYSRLSLTFKPCLDAQQRSLAPEQRDILRRFFAGKQLDKVLKIKVTVNPLAVSSATTLSSIHRKSGKDGEEWTTEIENDSILLPYFRVDSNTLVRIAPDFQSTREYNSTIAAGVLDIIKRASALITPTAPLITTQNVGRFNDAATFVDNTVNGLLHVTINEKPGITVAMDGLGGQPRPLAIITLVVPTANDAFPTADRPLVAVGQWIVWADGLRPSMLARYNSNGVIAGSYTASSVMNFTVADKKTLKEALAGSSSVTTARDALIAAGNNAATDPARVFCRTVASEADSLGLAPVDVGIVAWAALTDLALPQTKMTNALAGCNDVEHFQEVAIAASPGAVRSGR